MGFSFFSSSFSGKCSRTLRCGLMLPLRSSSHSRWLLEVSSPSPATTQRSVSQRPPHRSHQSQYSCPQYNQQKPLLTISRSQEQLRKRRSDSRSHQQCHVPLCLHFRLLYPGIQSKEQLQHLSERVRVHKIVCCISYRCICLFLFLSQLSNPAFLYCVSSAETSCS